MLLPSKEKSKLDIFERKERIMTRYLGVENILKHSQELDYLKEFLFDDKQLYMFNNLPQRNLFFYENQSDSIKFKNAKFEELLESLKLDNTEMSQKILRKFEEIIR
jgi:hypothetical protein